LLGFDVSLVRRKMRELKPDVILWGVFFVLEHRHADSFYWRSKPIFKFI